MRRILVIASILLLSISCKSNGQADMQLVNSFVEKVIRDSPKADAKVLEQYLTIKNENKEMLVQYIQAYISEFHKMIDNASYEVIDHVEKQRRTEIEQEVLYKGDGSLFYLISNNRVEIFFIVEEGKIVSFFGQVQKEQDSTVNPFFISR